MLVKVLIILEIALALGLTIYEAYKYYESKTNKKSDGDDPDADGGDVIYKL